MLQSFDVFFIPTDDPSIENNITYNASHNGVSFPHVRHTWGAPLPQALLAPGAFDAIVAVDILLYVEHYGDLLVTLRGLLEAAARSRRRDVESRAGEEQIGDAVPSPAAYICWVWHNFRHSFLIYTGRSAH